MNITINININIYIYISANNKHYRTLFSTISNINTMI